MNESSQAMLPGYSCTYKGETTFIDQAYGRLRSQGSLKLRRILQEAADSLIFALDEAGAKTRYEDGPKTSDGYQWLGGIRVPLQSVRTGELESTIMVLFPLLGRAGRERGIAVHSDQMTTLGTIRTILTHLTSALQQTETAGMPPPRPKP